MAKFIFSLGDANFRVLAAEAKTRDITIQELIRAVIIPDWMKTFHDNKPATTSTTATSTSSLMSNATGILNGRTSVIPPSIGRLKTS